MRSFLVLERAANAIYAKELLDSLAIQSVLWSKDADRSFIDQLRIVAEGDNPNRRQHLIEQFKEDLKRAKQDGQDS